ncbi:hypothetical protein [Paracoccus saliphilus]|uniref:Uncharacterized protein n=1 Tax=Paracoccus saliphilus TaxID=405559 RepID=A0AA45W544_9RHOB|nr:hypothetical protein [Paracoccus saliphilus]WCR02170.1 hypothetical protein JHX88_14830 [Paracoccus saliphilus]SIS90798.1 hypothetical protein SAMN05421772_10886 [Paracoccus saliphilus]
MIPLIREIATTVRMANDIAKQNGRAGPRWSLFLTNRSFIAQVFSLIFAALAIFGVPLPISAELAADTVYGVAFTIIAIWAAVERLFGKTRVIWSRTQANCARNEADALTEALERAGAW